MSDTNNQPTEWDRDRETCNAATPGPWAEEGVMGEGRKIYSCTVEDFEKSEIVDDGSAGGEYRSGCREADFAFITSARTRWPVALDKIAEQAETIRVMLDALKEVKWQGQPNRVGEDWPTCPSCGGTECDPARRSLSYIRGKRAGHTPDCTLVAAIKRAEATLEGRTT